LRIPLNAAATGKRPRLQNKYKLFFMALPFLILTFIFSYLPLHGWIYSFFNWKPGFPLSQKQYVGVQWFISIFSNPTQTGEILRVMRNTAAISMLNIAASILPVVFAILILEIKTTWLRKTVQILTTIPNFISWILVYSFAFILFSVDGGLINHLLMQAGIIDRGINFLASDSYTWFAMCAWSIWKGLGWGAIMYLAAIAGIDQELYEAGKADGAGRFRMIWHVTVPGILPTYFVLLLLSIANFINNGMDQYYVFQNAVNKDHIEVLDLYVYNIGMLGSNFSFATAVSMMKSIISILLLFFVNNLSRLVRGQSIV
jgi:putative aldouronate transport system permease protein